MTGKLHDADRCNPSTDVQLTIVVPTLKLDPLDGEQVVVSGAWPPEATGAGYITETGTPVRLCSVTGFGQLIAGAGVVGVVGLPQPD